MFSVFLVVCGTVVSPSLVLFVINLIMSLLFVPSVVYAVSVASPAISLVTVLLPLLMADVPPDYADPAPPSSADADSAPPSADDAADPAPSSFADDAPPSSADDVADPAPPPSVDDVDDPLPSDSDAVEMSCVPDSEPCSGDEEVLQSAGPVSLSPRRTRSSGPASNFPVDLPDSAPLVLDSSSPPASSLPRRLRFKPYLDVVVQRFRCPAERASSPALPPLVRQL